MRIMVLVALCAGLVVAGSRQSYAEECFTSSIMKPTPFMGNNDEVFRLTDGSVWQVKYEYEYLYEYYPEVIVCPSLHKLVIKGKSLNIVQLSNSPMPAPSVPTRSQRPATSNGEVTSLPSGAALIESRIDGEFKGWEGESIYKLMNGQIWQQVGAHYHYHYAYSPEVIIYGDGGSYKMRVTDDDDQSVTVQRLK